MPKPKVVVTRKVPGKIFDELFLQFDVSLWEKDGTMPRDELLAKVADAEGMHVIWVDQIDQELLDAAPNLKVVSNYAVGMNNIDIEACTKRGVMVGYTPGVVTEATADTAFALMLGISRRIIEAERYIKEGRWKEWSPTLVIGNDVFGKTLGIVGLGRIGKAIALRAKGFGMPILYHNRKPNPAAEQEFGVEYRTLEGLLEESDLVVLVVPYSPETHHLIGERQLARMKSSAFLINVARGGVVDSKALYRALSEGVIKGAGLDVTEPEPISRFDPLLTLDNCLIIPHVGTSTWETREAMTEISVKNLMLGMRGEAMLHCANPEVREK